LSTDATPAPAPALSQAASRAPYAGLTPDVALDALESVGLPCTGGLLALNSYENRVYQAGIHGDAPVIAKFYRPGRWSDEQILEEHAFVAELSEREIPVVSALTFTGKTLHTFAGFRFAVFPRKGGRAPNLDDKPVLEWIGRFIGRIHAVGALKPFAARPALNIDTFGYEPRDWLLAHDCIPPNLKDAWSSVVAQALDDVARCIERAGSVRQIRLHGDCHIGNVLWTEGASSLGAAAGGAGNLDAASTPGGPHFVDFDDARNGPAVQDLWMLFPSDKIERKPLVDAVLRGYEDFCEFDDRELHLIEALRTLRLLHYSAWLARRWDDPAFPAAFPWFNTQRYWEERLQELREQIALMREPEAGKP
jgi:Ser/Thr protein kinase RdoA (MazF antagonist)